MGRHTTYGKIDFLDKSTKLMTSSSLIETIPTLARIIDSPSIEFGSIQQKCNYKGFVEVVASKIALITEIILS